MSTPADSPDTEPLDRLWDKWKVVIDLFARQNVARHQIRADAYRTLHRQLLQSCETNSDARFEKSAQMAASIIRPWTSLESLNDAPVKILSDLKNSCLAVDREIQGRQDVGSKAGISPVVLFVILFVAIFATALFLMMAAGGSMAPPGPGELQGEISGFQRTAVSLLKAFEGRFHLWILGGLGLGIVGFLTFISMQSTRKY